MLCNICFRLSQCAQDVLGPIVAKGDHHQNLVSLLDAAEAGCYICEFVRQRCLDMDKRDNCRVKQFKFRQYRYGVSTQVLLDMEVCYDQEEVSECIGFWITPTAGFSLLQSEKIRKREGCIPEAEAVIKISEWMGLCLRDHGGTRCRKTGMQPNSYPSRLLDLDRSSFRVIRTTVDKPRGPYATLSYCWGPNPVFLRLTAENESELEAGIPISQLPLAFREAISVIQELSLRYVWIDCLCIIQSGPGSAEEWEAESSRMHKIYTDSILTLALTCVASPFESILNQTHTWKKTMPPFEIEADSGDEESTGAALAMVPQDYFNHTLYELPLSYRAWALQERVMATRVVSFGLGELFWDCTELPNASESIPGGLQATEIEPNHFCVFDLAKKAIPDGSDNDALFDTWWRLLREYTKRRLTYPEKDKLVAMSALAHDIGRAMNDVYIAGHFWKTLPLSLSWIFEDGLNSLSGRDGGRSRRVFWSEKPGAEDRGPRTPSWSWASVDGPVSLVRIVRVRTTQLAEAVSYTRELANAANPTGPCTSASLSIRAYCTGVEWQSQNEAVLVARTEDWGFDNIRFDVDLDEPEVIRERGSKSLLVALTEDEVREAWAGLVVEGIPYEGRIAHRRIGHFVIWDGDNMQSTWWAERISIFGEEKQLVELV